MKKIRCFDFFVRHGVFINISFSCQLLLITSSRTSCTDKQNSQLELLTSQSHQGKPASLETRLDHLLHQQIPTAYQYLPTHADMPSVIVSTTAYHD